MQIAGSVNGCFRICTRAVVWHRIVQHVRQYQTNSAHSKYNTLILKLQNLFSSWQHHFSLCYSTTVSSRTDKPRTCSPSVLSFPSKGPSTQHRHEVHIRLLVGNDSWWSGLTASHKGILEKDVLHQVKLIVQEQLTRSRWTEDNPQTNPFYNHFDTTGILIISSSLQL